MQSVCLHKWQEVKDNVAIGGRHSWCHTQAGIIMVEGGDCWVVRKTGMKDEQTTCYGIVQTGVTCLTCAPSAKCHANDLLQSYNLPYMCPYAGPFPGPAKLGLTVHHAL